MADQQDTAFVFLQRPFQFRLGIYVKMREAKITRLKNNWFNKSGTGVFLLSHEIF